jgi:hypothetical protein
MFGRRHSMRWPVVICLLVIGALALMAFTPLAQAAGPPVIGEPYASLLVIVLVPVVAQGLKIYREKAGKELSRQAAQVIVFVLVIPFVWLGGGFVGLAIPVLPTGTDPILLLPQALAWLQQTAIVLGMAYSATVAIYDTIGKAIFERAQFAKASTLKARALTAKAKAAGK